MSYQSQDPNQYNPGPYGGGYNSQPIDPFSGQPYGGGYNPQLNSPYGETQYGSPSSVPPIEPYGSPLIYTPPSTDPYYLEQQHILTSPRVRQRQKFIIKFSRSVATCILSGCVVMGIWWAISHVSSFNFAHYINICWQFLARSDISAAIQSISGLLGIMVAFISAFKFFIMLSRKRKESAQE